MGAIRATGMTVVSMSSAQLNGGGAGDFTSSLVVSITVRASFISSFPRFLTLLLAADQAAVCATLPVNDTAVGLDNMGGDSLGTIGLLDDVGRV
jgi:hypothetical protein